MEQQRNTDENLRRNKQSVLSVIIPIYQESEHIYNTVMHIDHILRNHNIFHNFILVDDGSLDNTWDELKRLHCESSSFKALRLTRNFGKESAICAGLEYADGEMAVVMDSDLQHPPELIPEMVRLWREENFDVVEGIKNKRGKENIWYRIGTSFFYRFLHKTASIDIENASDYKLLDRKVIEAWKKMPERTTFFRGMSAWVGFQRKQIFFDVKERVNGKSKWSLLRLCKLAINAITSYTTIPLQFITFIGILLFLLFIILGIQTLYMKFSGQALDGFTTVILLLLIIGSSVMMSLGIIGIYLSKIYQEVKLRPRYLVAEYLRKEEAE